MLRKGRTPVVHTAATAARAGWFAATAVTTTSALLLAAIAADDRSRSAGGAGLWAAYLVFVGVPGAIAAGVARFKLTRAACFFVMTIIGFWAGWSMGSSNDAQAGAAALIVPFVGLPLAGVVLVIESVVTRRSTIQDPDPLVMSDSRAAISDRLAALFIDLVLACAVLVVPLTVLSHRGQEIAAAIGGVLAGIGYLAGMWLARGATVGQSLLRLRVAKATTGDTMGGVQAVGRALLLIVELMGTATLFLLPLTGVEIVLGVTKDGRTVVDRLTRTNVLACR